ncbi:MAG: ATPase, T2SS/T4P/T4SS family [Candidatus Micrarchaeota archaeon]
MYETGWKIDSKSNNPYLVPGDYSLDSLERRILGELIDGHMEISKSPNVSPGNHGYAISGIRANDLRNELLGLLIRICTELNHPMRMERAKLILDIAHLNISGLGALTFLLEDDSLEEIAISGINTPFRAYKKGLGWLDSNCFFTSKEFAISTINRMARPLGRRITSSSPAINAMLLDGSRLHASIAPANREGIEITIRKFPKRPLGMDGLIANSTITAQASAFLSLACAGDTAILICGNTGSGKTTLLNALFAFVPRGERIISIEETPEISIQNPHWVRMVAGEGGLTMERLTQDTLRMRPDRVAIGEVRTKGEVSALFESLLAGQAKGAFATFHANSAKEALSRLRMLGIPHSDLSAIDLIIVIRRISEIGREEGNIRGSKRDGKIQEKWDGFGKITEIRRVMEISEIGKEGNIKRLFEYDGKSAGLICNAKELPGSALFEKLSLNYKMGPNELMAEMEKRGKGLEEKTPRPLFP